MPRRRRPYLPGVVFHLNARTQDGKPRFAAPGIRDRIADFIVDAVCVSDARLLAYVVMSNHLHLVVQQGEWELGEIMQPLLRRTALLVHSVEGTSGHVFERPFHDRACMDPYHVRNVIAYNHLNPVRAGIVADPGAYRWSSHSAYVAGSAGSGEGIVDAQTGLRLFGADPSATAATLAAGYVRYVTWRRERDRSLAGADDGDVESVPEPEEFRVTGPWGKIYAPLFPTKPNPDSTEGGRDAAMADLRDIAHQVFATCNPEPWVELEQVRSGCRLAELVRIRRVMVWTMAKAGHRGCDIARYMRVSSQCVSSIVTSERRRDARREADPEGKRDGG